MQIQMHHIKAHVAKLLGNLLLDSVGAGLVFITPVDEHDGGLGSCQLHLCQLLAHLLIEGLQIGGDKGVNQGGAVCTQRVLIHIHDSGSGIFRLPLIGVAHHSNLNAADVL